MMPPLDPSAFDSPPSPPPSRPLTDAHRALAERTREVERELKAIVRRAREVDTFETRVFAFHVERAAERVAEARDRMEAGHGR
jgi:hypothetical protein